MMRSLALMFVVACTATSTDPDGMTGGTGAGSTGLRGPPGDTGPAGEPGPAGSADDRAAILSKLAQTPFQKSVNVPIFDGFKSGATEVLHEYPTLDFGLGHEMYTTVPAPVDILPNSEVTLRFIVLNPDMGGAAECFAQVHLGGSRAYRAGAAWTVRPAGVNQMFTLVVLRPQAVDVEVSGINPSDVISVAIERSGSGTGNNCPVFAVAGIQLLYTSATP
jgi:hypothetical protein